VNTTFAFFFSWDSIPARDHATSFTWTSGFCWYLLAASFALICFLARFEEVDEDGRVGEGNEAWREEVSTIGAINRDGWTSSDPKAAGKKELLQGDKPSLPSEYLQS
jgi:hypothetical protein